MLDYQKIFIRELIHKKCGIDSIKLLKHFNKWKKTLKSDFTIINARIPWITYEAISILDRHITRDSRIFEYGGGGSTLYFLDKGASVVTVEHDRSWYDLLKDTIEKDKKIRQWSGILAVPATSESEEELDVSNPDHFISNLPKYRGMDFTEYVTSIDQYGNEEFDIVLIDGRSRPSCVKRAICKVKAGGLLILDNTERAYYTDTVPESLNDFYVILDEFSPTPTLEWFTKTTIWKKHGSRSYL